MRILSNKPTISKYVLFRAIYVCQIWRNLEVSVILKQLTDESDWEFGKSCTHADQAYLSRLIHTSAVE